MRCVAIATPTAPPAPTAVSQAVCLSSAVRAICGRQTGKQRLMAPSLEPKHDQQIPCNVRAKIGVEESVLREAICYR